MNRDNGTYCPLIFNEIYADSSGEYRLCCHADSSDCSHKYTLQTHNPFEYFLSPEMEEKKVWEKISHLQNYMIYAIVYTEGL